MVREVDHRPWPLPGGPWLLTQTLDDTLFLHWAVDPARLRPALPAGLELETRQGRAWLTVSPHLIRAARPRAAPPPLPSVSFPELNLRTYARVGERPGVYFFSLDAQSAAAVVLARIVYHLPYHEARVALGRAGGEGWVRAWRRSEPGVAFAARYRTAGDPSPAPPGSLDHWLLERYCAYGADRRGRLWRTDIHRPRWRVRPAVATIEYDTLTRRCGVGGAPALAHLADRQHVLLWPPRSVGGRRTPCVGA